MADVKVNKKNVEAFFRKEKTRALLRLGLVALVVGGAIVFMARENGTIAQGGVLALLGVILLFGHSRLKSPQEKYHRDVVTAKVFYLSQVHTRATRKTNVDLDDLLDFDTPDLLDLDLDPTSDSETHATLDDALSRKSQFLWGYPDSFDHSRYARVKGRSIFEFSPIHVSILYLTREEMLVYEGDVDILTGDLKTEHLNRFYLKEIVGISSITQTRRLKQEDSPRMFDEYRKVSGRTVSEIVSRHDKLRITKTDGRAIELPVGPPEFVDGTQGTLDEESSGDERFDRIVRELSRRINDAKESSPQGA